MIDSPLDAVLLTEARKYVARHDQNILLAATQLSVPYHFLRRFLKTGRGRHRNLEKLRVALASAHSQGGWEPSSIANLRNISQTGETLPLTRAILKDLLAAVEAAELRHGGGR